MVETISELKRQIRETEEEITREKKREAKEVKLERLKKKLKDLKLTPEERRQMAKKQAFKQNIKKITKRGFEAIAKQARLIRDQQDRDAAAARARGLETKKTASGVTVTRVVKRPVPKQLKKFTFKKKKKKKITRKSNKSKRPNQKDIFGDLQGFQIPGL
jgi:hypothetical protein